MTVVVGIDGSAGAESALRFALEEAQLRRLPLRIVCAWEAPARSFVGEAFAATADSFVEAEHHAEEILRGALAGLGPDTGVHIEALSEEGHPSTVLVEQARGATLLVVGWRGHGSAASLVLGSVSKSVAHHTPCPIVIVPQGPAAQS